MTNLEIVKALQKADVLKMRGRGSGGYNYYDDRIYNAGCYDWEVVCTPDGGYTQEYDFSHYENMFNENYGYYDEDTHTHPINLSNSDLSRDIQIGQEVLDSIKNGDVPIVVDNKVRDFLSGTSLAAGVHDVSCHQIVEHFIDEMTKDVVKVANVGKAVGIAGAAIGVGVAIYDLKDGDITESDVWGTVGAAAGVASVIISGPVGWVFGGISVGVGLYSYYLDANSSDGNNGY